MNAQGTRVPWNTLYHAGTDWFHIPDVYAGVGKDVRAISTGEVVYRVSSGYPGGVLIIKHRLPNNQFWYSQYGHIDGIVVNTGDRVNAGEKIATVLDQSGNTHIHWEVRTFGAINNLFPVGSAGERGLAYPPGYNNCNEPYGKGYTWDDDPAKRQPNYWGYTNPESFVATRLPKNYMPIILKDYPSLTPSLTPSRTPTPTRTPTPFPTPTHTPTPTLTPTLVGDSCEPNETLATACSIATGIRYFYIWPQTDNDYFGYSVSVNANQSKIIKIWVRSIPTGMNYNVALYDPSGNWVAGSSLSGNTSEYFAYTTTQSGVYKIRVYSVSGSHATDSYELQVEQALGPLGGYP